MTSTVIKTILISGGIGFAGLAQVDVLTNGGQLGDMTSAGLLGAGILMSVSAVAFLFNRLEKKDEARHAQNEKHSERLYNLIETTAQINTMVADNLKTNNQILVEVKDSMNKCKKD